MSAAKIIGQGMFAENSRDNMRVIWRLVDICDYNCPGCSAPKASGNLMLPKEKLVETATAILSLPSPAIYVSFAGGEPTLHPFLPDLLRYLLSSPRKPKACLATNGARNLDYYERVLRQLPAGSLSLEIYVHPRFAEAAKIITLIAMAKALGQSVAAHLVPDSGEQKKTFLCRQAMNNLLAKIPFNFKERPLGRPEVSTAADWPEAAFGANPAAPELLLEKDGGQRLSPGDANNFQGFACCRGLGVMTIDSEGYYYGSACPLAFRHGPAWKTGFNHDWRRITICSAPACPGGINAYLPKFLNREAAKIYFDLALARAEVWAAALPPMPDPNTLEYKPGDLIRLRVLRAEKGARAQRAAQAQPRLLIERLGDMERINRACAGQKDSRVFAHAMAALHTGNAACLDAVEPEPVSQEFVIVERAALRKLAPGGLPRKIQAELQPGDLLDAAIEILDLEPAAALNFMKTERGGICLRASFPVEASGRAGVSLIIAGGESGSDIIASVESALAQSIEDIGIIVIANGDRNAELREFGRLYPCVVKIIEDKGSVAANLADAIGAAKGARIALVEAGWRFPAGIPAAAFEPDADISAIGNFSPGFFDQGSSRRIESGFESLAAMLMTEGYPSFVFFRKSLLAKAARDGEMLEKGGVFGLKAAGFLLSKKTVFQEAQDPLPRSGGQYKTFAGFAGFSFFLAWFFETRGLDAGHSAYSACVRRVYAASEKAVFEDVFRVWEELLKKRKETRFINSFNVENLFAIGACRPALECVLAAYADLSCGIQGLNPPVAPGEEDWRAAAARPWREARIMPWEDAENPATPTPALTIIMPNYNKAPWLGECLESVFSQPMRDFELIIVDDASTDESWPILCDYAAAHPEIRLYRMEINCLQGICRNLAMKRARGEFLVFVDSDDRVEPAFFQDGLAQMRATSADMGFFAWQAVKPDGAIRHRQSVQPAVMDSEKAISLYMEDQIVGSPWAKIFRTSVTRASGVRFAAHVYHQDHHFTGKMLKAARRILASPILAYSIFDRPNSSINPAARKYLHIHSSCYLFDHFHNIAGNDLNNAVSFSQHMIWNLENIALKSFKAFHDATGEIALTDEDYDFIKANPVFLAALIAGYARLSAKNAIREAPQCARDAQGRCSPLLSVIIPVFNQEDRLGRCLDSALRQDMANFEIIVVDDASSDATPQICAKYAARDGRVRVLTNDSNSGQGYSRNRGIEMALGKYVAFVDSDDYVLPGFFSHAAAALEREPDADFIQFARRRDNNGKCVEIRSFSGRRALSGEKCLSLYVDGKIRYYAVWGNVYRKDFLNRAEVRFPEHMYEDEVFILSSYKKAARVLFDPRIVYANVITPHTHSTMMPLKTTLRHVNGYLARCAWIFANMGRDAAILLNGYTNSIFGPAVRDYLARFAARGICPLTDADMDLLSSMPDMLKIILPDYAARYCREIGAAPILGELDFNARPKPTHNQPLREAVFFPEKQEKPALSILVVVQDGARGIKKTVANAAELAGAEILLLDNDAPGQIRSECLDLAAQYSQVRYLATDWRVGIGRARQSALEAARGAYAIFMEPGTAFSGDFVEFGDCLGSNAADCFDIIICAPANEGDNEFIWDYQKGVKRTGEILSCFFAGEWRHGLRGKIFNRAFLERNGIIFSDAPHADLSFGLKCAAAAKSACFAGSDAAVTGPISHPADDVASWVDKFRAWLEIIRILENVLSENDEELAEAGMRWLFGSGCSFRADFLGCAEACSVADERLPASREDLAMLVSFKPFMRALMMDYALVDHNSRMANVNKAA